MSRLMKRAKERLEDLEKKIQFDEDRDQWAEWKKDGTWDFHFLSVLPIQEKLEKELVEAFKDIQEIRVLEESQEDAVALRRTMRIMSEEWRRE